MRSLTMERFPREARLGVVFLALVAALATTGGLQDGLRPAAAQEAEPGADAAAEPAAEPAPAAAGQAQPTAAREKPTMLQWLWDSLGITYTVAFLALSFTFVAILVMMIISARRENICPPQLIEGFESHLGQGAYQEAYDLARADESFLGQVLAAGLTKVSTGYAEAIEAMQEVGEEENMKLEHRLSYIALIGTVSPMVGLLGTVDGMIRSFSVIATATTTPKPSELAKGVATALVTTLIGLLIAIPAVAAYNLLRNRMARLVLEVGIRSEELMSHFQQQKR